MKQLKRGLGRGVPVLGGWLGSWTLVMSVACTPAFDVIGVDEAVLEQRSQKTDALSQKTPEYDPERTIEEVFDDCELTLNKSASVTRLSIEPLAAGASHLEGVIFPTRAAALEALGDRDVVASMEVVNGALKVFNDGMYAAIELATEGGSDGSLVNKRAVLDALLETMLAKSESEPAARAALELGASRLIVNEDSLLTGDLEVQAKRTVEQFDSDVHHSTPIGFYTWSDPLEDIFRRDRFLQYQLGSGADPFATALAVSEALREDAELRGDYERLLQLGAGLTNPSRHYAPTDLAAWAESLPEGATADRATFQADHPEFADSDPQCGSTVSWLPPSDSPERRLLASDYCNGHAPENLLARLIEAIQSGEIDLTPSDASGWYDWQLFALETLLVPERAPENEHLLLTQAYKDKLIESFKSILIQTRETHVKQLEDLTVLASAPPPPVDVYPLLPVEPFPTFYLRTARAYEFLSNVLRATLGQEALQSISRLREDGTRAELSLAEELAQKTELLYGLHLVAAASIGMADSLSDDERAQMNPADAQAVARRWLDNWQEDPDVLVDPRVAVPLVVDDPEQVVRNLGVVGVKVIRMHASFPKGYEPEVVGGFCEVRQFVPFEPYLLVEQSVEFATPIAEPPFTRERFRARLDGLASVEAMIDALEGR